MSARLLFAFCLLLAERGYSFDKPNRIYCFNKGTIRIENDKEKRSFYKKNLSLTILQSAKLVFLVHDKAIAKVYPQEGVDFLVLDKTYQVQSDNRTFWKITNSAAEILFSCELKNE